ncbi:hypothetical protein [Paraburkholderia bannensis]|uniref:hypothetical protein n=1 Tax=Paraburkholderia bannensis TaxID=765414 RepID=UPI002AB1D694|nr:hypothetical protein [Paraburkholderia bannensis]
MPTEFLVIFQYHEPEPFRQFEAGLLEDYESTSGVYVAARTREQALEWGEVVATALLRHSNAAPALDWKAFKYTCWVEDKADESPWAHCLEFFPRVRAGELPALEQMDTAAYSVWAESRGCGASDK